MAPENSSLWLILPLLAALITLLGGNWIPEGSKWWSAGCMQAPRCGVALLTFLALLWVCAGALTRELQLQHLLGPEIHALAFAPGSLVKAGDRTFALYGTERRPDWIDADRFPVSDRWLVIGDAATSATVVLQPLQPEADGFLYFRNKVEQVSVIHVSMLGGFAQLRRSDGTYIQGLLR